MLHSFVKTGLRRGRGRPTTDHESTAVDVDVVVVVLVLVDVLVLVLVLVSLQPPTGYQDRFDTIDTIRPSRSTAWRCCSSVPTPQQANSMEQRYTSRS